MYQIAICEDEPQEAEYNAVLVCHILESRNMQLDVDYSIHTFFSPAPLLAQLEKQPGAFHLLLLDISLGSENGLNFAGRLREKGVDSSIVYITAYRDFVFDCFDTRPLCYLLKPVDGEKLAQVIDRDLRENYRPEQIQLPVHSGWRTVTAHDILYAEATSHKSAVHLQEETIYINRNFSDLLPRLCGNRFCRCHFSIVVNLEHVHKLAGSRLLLDNGAELPVSRSRRKEVKKQLISFIR